jgi:hypothetical protein
MTSAALDLWMQNVALWAENAALRARIAELEEKALAAQPNGRSPRRPSLKTGDTIRVSCTGMFGSGPCIVTSVKYQLGDCYHFRAGGKIKKNDKRIHFAPCPRCPDHVKEE